MSNALQNLFSFIVDDEEKVPVHLKHRAPSFILSQVEIVYKQPFEKICPAGDGKVQMAGAIEFQARINPGKLTDYCDPDELHNVTLRTTHRFRCVYDPTIQRGAKDTKDGLKEYLKESNIVSMMEDIEKNVFECPQLMWNLRAGESIWVYLTKPKELRIYQGVATRPDTNHRHHAIIRFHKKYLRWVEETESMEWGGYNPTREYALILYTDDYEQEAHRFYVYNYKGWRVSTSTAHYIESKTRTPALHAKLARLLMESSGILGSDNVEIVSNNLSRNSAKMVTFGTLNDGLKMAFPGLGEDEVEQTLSYLVKFLEQLHKARPDELALVSVSQRKKVRDTTIADQAIMWQAYLRLAAWLQENAPENWKDAVQKLAGVRFRYRGADNKLWTGDLFSRTNPLWLERGIIAPGKTGLKVVHGRSARQAVFDVIKEVVSGKDFAMLPSTPATTELSLEGNLAAGQLFQT
jgi:DNA-sulfur modification-associated